MNEIEKNTPPQDLTQSLLTDEEQKQLLKNFQADVETLATEPTAYDAAQDPEKSRRSADASCEKSDSASSAPAAAKRHTASRQKRKTGARAVMSGLLKLAGIVVLTVISMWLLSSGDKMSLEPVTASAKDRTTTFNGASANLLGYSLDEIHHMPKIYILPQNDDPTPMPNEACFDLLESDDIHKSYDDRPVEHYKDDTIEVYCWREMIDSAVFNFAEITIEHPSQLRRKLVDNVISNKHLDYPLNIFQNMHGVVGMTSDYCAYRDYGTVVQYGNIVRDEPHNNLDLLIYDKDGNFDYVADQDFHSSKYYQNEDVLYTFAFGPMLVNDYTVNTSQKMIGYPTGEVSSYYPRAAIGQFDYDKHYLLCTVDYTRKMIRGTTVRRLAQIMQAKGVRFAYNLDGGQTAALMFHNELFNVVAYGGQRPVSDILYFATAIPNNE